MKNEIYQSILNYSNIYDTIESSLLNCLSGIIYLSSNLLHSDDLSNNNDNSNSNDHNNTFSNELTQQCVKFAKFCMNKIFTSKYLF